MSTSATANTAWSTNSCSFQPLPQPSDEHFVPQTQSQTSRNDSVDVIEVDDDMTVPETQDFVTQEPKSNQDCNDDTDDTDDDDSNEGDIMFKKPLPPQKRKVYCCDIGGGKFHPCFTFMSLLLVLRC